MRAYVPAAVAVFLGGMITSATLNGADFGHIPWYMSRASGIVAFGLLSLSVILGLTISTKSPKPVIPRGLAFDLHQFLSILTLTLVGAHAGILMFDGFTPFSPLAIVMPFAAPWEPLVTGLGTITAWLLVAVTASFWLRRRIGQRAWRRFHYVSFAAYLLSLLHGLTAGPDTGVPQVHWAYVLSAATVAGLLTYRISFRSGVRTPAASPPRRSGAAASEAARLTSRPASR